MIFLIVKEPERPKSAHARARLRRCGLCGRPTAGFEALCPRCAKRAATAPGFRFLPLAKKGGAK